MISVSASVSLSELLSELYLSWSKRLLSLRCLWRGVGHDVFATITVLPTHAFLF